MNGHDVARVLVGFVELGSLVEGWTPVLVTAVVVAGLLAVAAAHLARRGRPDR